MGGGAEIASILREGFEEYHHFVNPLVSQRARLVGEPIRVVAARGGLLVDVEGQEVEDFHGTQAFGHRHPAIARAIIDYLESDAPSWYPSRVNPFAGRFARRLCERTGGAYDNVFFACTGSGAVEAALKLARALTRRPRILALEGGYHGCTMGSNALMGHGYLRDPFGPHLPGVSHLPFGDTRALEAAMGDDVAALVVEPIQGEGGVRVLPQAWVEAACRLCEQQGALLVADEVQTGLGRTGRGFLRSEAWPRRPDVVALAKHLGGGLVPMAAMLTRRELFLRAYGQDFASGESHNNTMGSNALAAVAGLAALELLDEALIEEIARKGARFEEALREEIGDHELVEEIRGEGLMRGVVLRQPEHPWLSFEHMGYEGLEDQSVMAPLLCHRLYRRGFFCFTCGHDWRIFRLQPRFEIPMERLLAFARVCREELDALLELT